MLASFARPLGKTQKTFCIKRYQYDIWEGVCDDDVFFTRLSDFDQHVSTFLKPACFFNNSSLSNPSTPICCEMTLVHIKTNTMENDLIKT